MLDSCLNLDRYTNSNQAPPSDPGDPDFNKLLDESSKFWASWRETGHRRNGEAAISHYRQALALAPDAQSRIRVLHYTGRALVELSTAYGELALLSDAIACAREALALAPPGHQLRLVNLDRLGRFLDQRFVQTHDMGDIKEAIDCFKEVILLYPEAHPGRKVSVKTLGMAYQDVYDFNYDRSYLYDAIKCQKDALALCSEDDDERAHILSHLCIAMYHANDRDSAIKYGREALPLMPEGAPERLVRINNLATMVHGRFTDLGDCADLYEALALKEEAYSLCPRESIFLALVSYNLADSQAAYLCYWYNAPDSPCVPHCDLDKTPFFVLIFVSCNLFLQ